MQIGMIGLGRMGGNMARRLTKGGHQCVVFDRNRENINALAKEGPAPAYSRSGDDDVVCLSRRTLFARRLDAPWKMIIERLRLDCADDQVDDLRSGVKLNTKICACRGSQR